MKENSIEETIKQLKLMLKVRKEQKEIIECAGGSCMNCNPDIKALSESIDILSDYKRVLKEDEELKDTNTYLQKENEELKERIREHTLLISPYYVKENFIPVQKVKDKIKEILKNGEYRIIFEGDAEFPDEATIITAQKYLKLEKVQKLQQENERLRKQSKIMCDEYCPYAEKIKAKIEELDIAILECEYSDDDSEEYKKEVEQDKLELLKQKRVLQELLEGRK